MKHAHNKKIAVAAVCALAMAAVAGLTSVETYSHRNEKVSARESQSADFAEQRQRARARFEALSPEEQKERQDSAKARLEAMQPEQRERLRQLWLDRGILQPE